MARPRKVSEERLQLEVPGGTVPVRVITEVGRRSVRAAVGQQALLIRLPRSLGKTDRQHHLNKMLEWARRTAREKPGSFRHLLPPEESSAYAFTFRGTEYRIDVVPSDLSFHRILATGQGSLTVQLCTRDSRQHVTKVIPKLLAKYFAGQCLGEVTQRVLALNGEHFQKRIRAVKLKDMYTRWGSCSHTGNINLAARLLLAPPEIMDAVIIHELAHLVVANHSDAFWSEVERALPDYRKYDKWLNEHGNTLRFDPVPL